ncbi:MAG: toprim domain-containing protein [Roseomonas sp.]|nr:toprim domain-containing protein [Roseomonas sp.]
MAAVDIILPAPQPLPDVLKHPHHGKPSAIWRYHNAAGELLFAVCRFDPPGARKEILPLTFTTSGWKWKAPPAPRPLYGLDRMAAHPSAPVLITEGEKAADAAGRIFPDFVAIAWPGGAQAVTKADWSALQGRRVVIWPDNDAPGRKAAADVAKAVTAAGAASVAIVSVPEDWPEKWDVADDLPKGATADTLRALLTSARSETASPADRLRAVVVEAAGMAREDWLTVRRDLAQLHRVPVAELDAMRAEAQRAARPKPAAEEPAEPPPVDSRGRVDLLVNGADLPDTAQELAEILAAQPHLFDRGGPARIARDRTRGAFVVEALTIHSVVTEAHRIARPWRWNAKRDGPTERADITLPERVARLYLDHRDGWNLRTLDGITSAPLLHDDGSIRAADGYDPTTRLWCESVPAVDVPENPSRAEAEAALLKLRHWFRTIAFADAERVHTPDAPAPVVDVCKPPGADESAFLVALLTAICRPCLWLAPALLVRAPEYSGAGTGKGLLVRCISAIAFGQRPVAMTAGATAEELEKRLAAALMEARQTLYLDNVNAAALRSDLLASAITERPAAIRLLGQSKTVPLTPTAFIAVTGNGVSVSEDLARRFVTVELDAGIEDPETRDFRGDLLNETMAARAELLGAALTIWRWGRMLGDDLSKGRSLGSFGEWGRWCRDPLLALGCRDPVARVADAKAADPRRQKVAEIFTAWWQAHGAKPIAVADLAEPVKDAADPAGRGRQYLASVIRTLDGTRAAGFVLTRSASVGRWQPDRYALSRAQAQPMTPMPQGTAGDDPDAWRGEL